MKSLVALLSVLLLLAIRCVAVADDQTRDAQAELKSLGFYYGEVSGQPGTETSAAIRRYQIRNGLEVTGLLDKQTLDALGVGGGSSAPTKPPAPARAPARAPSPAASGSDSTSTRPPVHLRRDPSVEESDRSFLRKEDSPRVVPPQGSADPSVVSPPARIIEPSSDLPVLFADTPYATAPAQVQESMLRSVQALLASRGFYRDVIDGVPGPATEEALFSYQRSARLPLTGRLDLETLAQLRLLPGRNIVRVRPSAAEPPPRVSRRSVFRGVWIE